METTVRDVLLNALENLESRQLNRFRRKLTDVDIDEDYSKIPRGRLENAEADRVVDIIRDFYGDSYGCKLTLDVLIHINERQVEDDLRKDLEKIQRPTFAKLPSVQNNVKVVFFQLIYLLLSSGNSYINLSIRFSSQQPKTKKELPPSDAVKEFKEENTTQTDQGCCVSKKKHSCKSKRRAQGEGSQDRSHMKRTDELVPCPSVGGDLSLATEPHLLSIQKNNFENIQINYQNLIEEKITDLLMRCREKNQKPSDNKLKKEFEKMWKKTLRDLQRGKSKTRVVKSMFQQLMNDMSNKGLALNQDLLGMKDLADVPQPDFKMDEKYIDSGWVKKLNNSLLDVFGIRQRKEQFNKINDFAHSLIGKCNKYIRGKVGTGEDYNDNFCQELLHMINTEFSKQFKSLGFSMQFELNIKMHILGKASREFQEMHDKSSTENSPKVRLGRLKPGYLKTFIETFQEKDVSQTKAKEFIDQCLKPAMKDYVVRHLGQKIVDIVVSNGHQKFSRRSFLHRFFLEELLEEMSFQKFVQFIGSYEEYTKDWILNCIERHATPQTLKPLQENLLGDVYKNIGAALGEDTCLNSSSASDLLKSVCEILKEELVIPQDAVQAVDFLNTADVGQFSSDIQLFLQDTETEVLSELQSMDIKSVLSRMLVKPQDELFKKVVGCGKQCPFCGVLCEANDVEHEEHFATVHRPEGLGRRRLTFSGDLSTDTCTTSVTSDDTFSNLDTGYQSHPYREYRTYYPDWAIQPDPSIECSDYWKYILVSFNEEFTKEYKVRPATIPDDWRSITKEKALESLKNM